MIANEAKWLISVINWPAQAGRKYREAPVNSGKLSRVVVKLIAPKNLAKWTSVYGFAILCSLPICVIVWRTAIGGNTIFTDCSYLKCVP